MAKVNKNIVIQGLSGSLGDQLVVQGGKGGQTIIRTKARPSDREPTAAQQEVRERFQEATAYGKGAKDDPAYAKKAAGMPQTTYNVAVADWFHAPEVDEVDLSAWTGGVGEALRARARDDVEVKAVYFLIATEDGTLVEAGAGTPEGGGPWWRYETTVDHPGLPACLRAYTHRQAQAGGPAKVLVTAKDLPGHEGILEAEKAVS